MTRIFDDPAEFTADAVEGFADLYASHVRAVPGGVVRRMKPRSPKVAVIVGGGSGHYPAFMGVVGPGFADGAVVGNIFTSPSTAQAYSVGRIAHSGAGVIYTYGNYAGDVMNFGMAGERLHADGIDARQLIVTDDIASASPAEAAKRRGIAGDFVVFKVLGAAAERGLDIDEVERLGLLANARTYTLGIAFSGCTFPGAEEPLFIGSGRSDGARARDPRRAGTRGRRQPARAQAGAPARRQAAGRASGRVRRPGRSHPQRARHHQVRGAVRPLEVRLGPAARGRPDHRRARGGRAGDQPRHGRRLADADLAGRRARAAVARRRVHAGVPSRRGRGDARFRGRSDDDDVAVVDTRLVEGDAASQRVAAACCRR